MAAIADANSSAGAEGKLCTISPGVSNNTCTESSLYTGITMKF